VLPLPTLRVYFVARKLPFRSAFKSRLLSCGKSLRVPLPAPPLRVDQTAAAVRAQRDERFLVCHRFEMSRIDTTAVPTRVIKLVVSRYPAYEAPYATRCGQPEAKHPHG